jgi:hypothetical protein|uniref:GNAT family N-acetyltransferase n=1 Tax=Ignavibacterium album TaxID=591197 RepID=A0A7V2ZI79_9BACT
MNDITIKEFSIEDKEGSIELLKTTFPGASNEETFKWRYESYEKLKPLIIIAKSGEKVVSFVSWMPWVFNYEDKQLIGYQACEGATATEFRNKGLFTKMFLFSEQLAKEMNIDFYFGFPSKMSYGPVYRAGYYPIINFKFAKRYLIPGVKKNFRLFTESVNFSDDDFFLYDDDKISPVFNQYYHEWRFQKNPFDYDTIIYEENNNKVLFVLRSNKSLRKKYGLIPKKIMIVDFQTTAFFDELIENAINYLCNEYKNRASYLTTFFNAQSSRGNLLSRYFKLKTRLESRILCVRPINYNKRNIILNGKLWDIMPHIVDYY